MELERTHRAASKRGLASKPKTMVDVGLLLFGQLEKLNETMLGISDVLRFAVGYPPFCFRFLCASVLIRL